MIRSLGLGFRKVKVRPVTSSWLHYSFSCERNQSETVASPLDSSHWEALKHRFEKLQNDNGEFPLSLSSKSNPNSLKDSNRQAAVLVLLCTVDQEVSVLFTKRSSDLKRHPSEISFPGGHVDPDDPSVTHTALRETEEELLPQLPYPKHDHNNDSNFEFAIEEHIEIVGQTTSLPSLRGTPVTPVIGIWKPPLQKIQVSNVFPGHSGEVETVFTVPIAKLLDQESSEELPPNRFNISQGPIFPTEHGKIWGLTAYILRPLLHKWIKPVLVPGNARNLV